MTEHTKEPWRVSRANPSPTTGEWMIAGASNGYLAEIRDCGGGSVAANARRVVACVNAMAGIDDDNVLFRRGSIGTVRKHIVTQQVQIEKLTAQRDQLLAALELADAMLSGANMNANVVERKVKAAIAAVKGGAEC